MTTHQDNGLEAERTATPPTGPSSEPPSVTEPTEPRPPLPPSPEQSAPATVTPTGAPTGADETAVGQQGPDLTTSLGTRLRDTDHSLKAGSRGPLLLQDHHLREKITHFDHERIPERVVHARGAGAHGEFVAYGNAAGVTCADFLAEGVRTPVFVRFSTVLGSRGSADTVRDTRGFATKFYTREGVFDLVGNNMPVFFIQDGIKFPDIIHAGKPHPDREIPQAQSAHDTFWDFVSLHTEAQHHTMWNMSDRGIPRSFRMMEGFGVHTFRLQDADGSTTLAKLHWKPRLGVHSLTWEEAQLAGGVDPDFHRRDLYDAIESGACPEWELGLQVFPDTEEQTFEGIDLLDPTKMVPEELAPVQPVGRMTLTGTPTNFFAEVEQVAFHVGNLVPGIDVTDDPLMQVRLFSYVDTQLTRLGGPNFNQLPINRSHAPVNDMLRDGFGQQAVHGGVAPYRPNSLDGGCPFVPPGSGGTGTETPQVTPGEGWFVETPREVPASRKVRAAPASFADHFTQARLFWLSMTSVEQDHIVAAYTFELGKCYESAIRERQLMALGAIDGSLAERVAEGLGMPVPEPVEQPAADVVPSPALRQVGEEWPVDGRKVGILVDSGSDLGAVADLRDGLLAVGIVPLVIAPAGGPVGDSELVADRTYDTVRSVEMDGLLLANSASDAGSSAPDHGRSPVALLVDEVYRQAKPIAALGGEEVLTAVGVAPGTLGTVSGDADDLVGPMIGLLARHRVWDRLTDAT